MKRIGKYCVLGKIGQGGMASVYLVEDERIGKRWAVKAIPKNRAAKDGIMLLKELDHPSLPRIVEELDSDDMYYEVMDYFAGTPLDKWAEAGISPSDAIHTAGQILESAAYLHSLTVPVIHRDIKPANFILTREKKVKLIDFDLAVSGERTGLTPLGTKGYAPPEQYRGICSMRGDVYSLGRTIGFLMRNVRFKKTDFTERRLIRQIEGICLAAASDNREKRYGDAGEMLAAFDKCCHSRRRIKAFLTGFPAVVLALILAISGRGILRGAFAANAATKVSKNYTEASALISQAITYGAYEDALKADDYIRSSKHLLENLDPEIRVEFADRYYLLHHTALIVAGSVSDSDSERTDAFRTCVSDDIEYEDFLRKYGCMEDIFHLYADDAALCRVIGDDGSAERFYDKAVSMPGISAGMRTALMKSEGRAVEERRETEDEKE